MITEATTTDKATGMVTDPGTKLTEDHLDLMMLEEDTTLPVVVQSTAPVGMEVTEVADMPAVGIMATAELVGMTITETESKCFFTTFLDIIAQNNQDRSTKFESISF